MPVVNSLNGLLRLGIIGSGIAALCCFTPVLVIVLGAAGLGAAIAYLDMILLPLLAIFLGVTGFALYQRHRQDVAKDSVP